MTKEIPVITIDGPSGAGKGTIAQMLALDLNWNILDSGALYRTLAYFMLEKDIDLSQFEEKKFNFFKNTQALTLIILSYYNYQMVVKLESRIQNPEASVWSPYFGTRNPDF